ncbi:lysophospholipid acyltransferase family protein [Nocardioides panaciterrulae]|uniref:1-acyl-sn-glycerol-3-phosphate acyltransferase n=1 Tax=Nocardioides panaciterrulae TaxID=661492 RepID=A0A7Y9JDL1_9ACTN|nr:lysophospholipid acyltransferase family protein [Nocardioides panaciterrulae]NYD43374.1 1-acyl-sn-glycerol-3-phosphate acyltransferase [Nocardioides panaciterrulae]
MREGWYRSVNVLGRVLLWLLGISVRVRGQQHLPRSGPVVLASVHGSFLDFVLVEKAALERGRLVRFLCRHDVWRAPLVGRAMDGMRHVPVDREAPAAAYLTARRLLGEGEAVCVFPEAGISHSFTVRSLMRGAAALAVETGAPLVPVVVWGGQRVLPLGRHGRRPRPDLRRGAPVDVCFGPPLPVCPGDDLTRLTERLGHTLTAMLEQVQRLPAHRPAEGEWAPWYPAHLGGDAPDRRAALLLDEVPRAALPPSWGPTVDDPLR